MGSGKTKTGGFEKGLETKIETKNISFELKPQQIQ